MLLFCVYWKVFEQQYTSSMKVGTGGNLGLSRKYHEKLFGPLFYTWWNYPLSKPRGCGPCRVAGVDLPYDLGDHAS